MGGVSVLFTAPRTARGGMMAAGYMIDLDRRVSRSGVVGDETEVEVG